MKREPSGFVVDWAAAADARAIVDLVNEAYRTPGPQAWTSEAHLLGGQRTDAAMVESAIGVSGGGILLLREPDGIVGCVHLEPAHTGTCHLGLFAVRPDRQGAGRGGALIAHAEQIARHGGSGFAEIAVIAQRQDLIAWYERRGYQQTGGQRPFPYGEPRFGRPRRPDLVFCILRKVLADPS
ncbi:MAG: GNAT family N-acetyltransferase [Gammaproteobacteria bacterium]|nr:GNAT family N-acetyltransferase [Gammaproteobacteria bacterium]